MFKNLKLGLKLSISFGILIVITIALGAIAITNLRNIETEATMLSEEYAPEVEIANNIERESMMTMYNMRGYGFTEEQKYLDSGRNGLKSVNKYLNEAEGLITKAKHLLKLKSAIDEVKDNIKQYSTLVDETVILNTSIAGNRKTLDKSAKIFMNNCNDYLNGQTTKAKRDIDKNIEGNKVSERIIKITIINNIINTGNEVRIAAWRSQAERSPLIIENAIPKFNTINNYLNDLIKITTKQYDIDFLNNISKSAQAYKSGMLRLLENWEKLQAIGTQRNDAAVIVLEKSKGVSLAGIKATLTISENAKNISAMSTKVMLGGLILSLIIGVTISIIMTKVITGPLLKGVNFATAVANGDLESTIDLDQKDEIGQLANALKSMVAQLKIIVLDIKSAANNVAAGSEELSSSSQEMSQGATEQAAAAEEASSSMEQMTSNIVQNADNAMQTEKIALKTAKDAKEGGNAVNETVTAMKEIADKISIIEEISRQTNLLALNAAIEAARAGEHGKGFAVVASEVRKLAERSQEAAGEIGELSSTSVAIAEKAGSLLTMIVPDIQKTAELVQEISASSSEQRTGAEQINMAIQQLDLVIQQNASASEEMASTSEELSSQASQLQETIAFFQMNDNSNQQRPSMVSNPKKMLTYGSTSQSNTSKHSNTDNTGISLNMGSSEQQDQFDYD